MVTTDFTKNFQIELITNLYHDLELLKYACKRLLVTDLDLSTCKLVYFILSRYYNTYKKLPNFTVLTMEVSAEVENPTGDVHILPEEFDALGIILERIHLGQDLDSSYYKDKLADYIVHARSANIMEQHGSADMKSIVTQMAALDRLSVDADELQFSNPSAETYPIMTEEEAKKISVGVSSLDYRLARGLAPGQMGMITACSGVGKTNTILNFGLGAVFQGYRALILTLELSGKRMTHRHIGMLGCIRAGMFQIPMPSWPDIELAKYHYVTNPKFKYANRTTIVDMSKKSTYTVDDIDSAVSQWKEMTALHYGEEEAAKCLYLGVDWLDKIHPGKLGKDVQSHEYLKTITENLSTLSRKHDVALWTATQGSKDGDGAVKVTGKHNAWSYHKIDALDVGIGVAPVDNLADNEEIPDTLTDVTQIKDCSKLLNFNLYKNRDAPEGDVTLYIGPPLRLFNNQQDWLSIDRSLKKGNFEVLGEYVE